MFFFYSGPQWGDKFMIVDDSCEGTTKHYGTNPGRYEKFYHSLSHVLWSESVNEVMNERSGEGKQSEQCGVSECVNSASVRANRQASGPVLIIGCSGPKCEGGEA